MLIVQLADQEYSPVNASSTIVNFSSLSIVFYAHGPLFLVTLLNLAHLLMIAQYIRNPKRYHYLQFCVGSSRLNLTTAC